MTYLFAVLAGIAGLVAGWAVAAGGALLFASATGMSNFEGAAGMFAVFGIGPIGGLVGLILGIWLVLRYRGRHFGFGSIAIRSLLVIVAIGVLIAGGFGVTYLTRDTVNAGGPPPRLLFDLRLPPGIEATAKDLSVEMHTNKNVATGIVFSGSERRDGDRLLISGSIDLYFRTSQRMVVVKRRGEPDRLFQLTLSSSPKHMREPGSWQPVSLVAGPGEQPRKPDAGDGYELRYRVAWVGED
jgi:hypothetical protein